MTLGNGPPIAHKGSPRLTETGRRAVTVVLGGVLFLGAALIPLLRQSGTRSWWTIWSEDGFEYFEQAHKYGGLSVLFRGYGGYLQLPPRLLAVMAAHVPVHALSVYLAVSATSVNALLALFLYDISREWIPSRSIRLALSSMVVLMPALGTQNTADITNTIWVFFAVAPWALVSLAERPLAVASRSIVAFLAATATSLSVFFAPLAVVFVLVRKTRAARTVAAVFFGGLVVQGLVIAHTRDTADAIPNGFLSFHRSIAAIAESTGLNVFGMFLVGTRGTGSSWLANHYVLAVAATILFVVVLVVLLRGATRSRKLLAITFTCYAPVIYAAPVWNRQQEASR